jgi:hypothetical protein
MVVCAFCADPFNGLVGHGTTCKVSLSALLLVVLESLAVLAPPPTVDGPAMVAVVDHNRLAMKLCYQRVLRHEPELRVKLVTRLRIDRAGQVVEVSFDDPHAAREEVGQCLSAAMRQWVFPTANRDYRFEFPVVMMRD